MEVRCPKCNSLDFELFKNIATDIQDDTLIVIDDMYCYICGHMFSVERKFELYHISTELIKEEE